MIAIMFRAKLTSMNIDKTTITAMLFGVLMSPFTFLSNIYNVKYNEKVFC